MQREYKRLKIALSVIVTVVLVAYALIVYLPHGHDCLAADCAVCNMIDFKRDILIGASLFAIAQILPRRIFMLPALHQRIVLFSERTPVGLKVKLSD